MCQAGNYAGFDRVGRDYDNRNFSCCLLCRQRTGDIERHNHIDLKSDQFGSKFGKSIQLSFPGAKLECNVLPFNMAKFTQSFPEFLFERLRVREAYVEHTYSSHLGLLPARRNRPDDRSAAEERNEVAPFHETPSRAEGHTSHVGVCGVFRQALCSAPKCGSHVQSGSNPVVGRCLSRAKSDRTHCSKQRPIRSLRQPATASTPVRLCRAPWRSSC